MPRLLVDIGPLRRNRNFRLSLTGPLFSLLGSNLTVVATPNQVDRATHSSHWVGPASLIQLPLLIGGSLWGGAMGDRADERVLLTLSALVHDLLSGARSTPGCTASASSTSWCSRPSPPASPAFRRRRTAAIPELVGPDELIRPTR